MSEHISASPLVDFAKESFAPVFVWPAGVKPTVLDLSSADAQTPFASSEYTIGRYNERRGIYTSELFVGAGAPEQRRDIHVGIDLGGPVGTPVMLPCAGTVAFQGYNAADGDYGHVVITRHELQGRVLYMLFGHLDKHSTSHATDVVLPAGYVVGRLGDRSENGGWPPHVHFQLSFRAPTTHDLPGAVSSLDLAQALIDFPDPRLVLGAIY